MWGDVRVVSFRKDQTRFATEPVVAVREKIDEFPAGKLREVEPRSHFRFPLSAFRFSSCTRGQDVRAPMGDAINSSVAFVPVVHGIDVRGARITPVHNVERAIGTGLTIDRAEG